MINQNSMVLLRNALIISFLHLVQRFYLEQLFAKELFKHVHLAAYAPVTFLSSYVFAFGLPKRVEMDNKIFP